MIRWKQHQGWVNLAKKRWTFVGMIAFLQVSCAVLHRVQFSDMNKISGGKKTPISIKASETTIDLLEVGTASKSLGKALGNKGAQQAGSAFELVSFFLQFGPKTGTPVFNDRYARDIPEKLSQTCSGGTLTEIVSVRETRSYPVVKGEIVRVDGICVRHRS